MATVIRRYGKAWTVDGDNIPSAELKIEFDCIRRCKDPTQLFQHYRNAISLCWPDEDHHRWSDLILKTILENRIVVLAGARDSGKTHGAAKWALIDYWAFPQDTLVLMTSTTLQGLEMRVWGGIKKLFREAKERHSWLAGNVVDAKHGLFTDNISDEEEVRVQNKGIIGIPTMSSQEEYQGTALKNFAGIKQKRRRLVGDECQFLPCDYLKVLDSLDKGDFHGVLLGNPIADNGRALDKVSEPVNGWNSLGDVTKTSVWPNKYGGVTVNLVGIDSPNFDKDRKKHYPYMVDQDDVKRVSERPGGKDSVEWWSLIMGVRKSGVIMNRVLTLDMVERSGGFKSCLWQQPPQFKIMGIDAGFGGDPCVATVLEAGEEVGGGEVILFGPQEVVPIAVSSGITAEDQIANWAKIKCDALGIPYGNVFVECGMRATLAVSFSRILSPDINAINFGGPATQRPMANGLFVYDEKNNTRRAKTCYEHFSKFVTEMAYNVRYLVENQQARNFPRQAAEEFQKRVVRFVYNDRHELETKQEYKERSGGESPNNADSVMVAVEGALRLGFQIKKVVGESAPTSLDWLRNLREQSERFHRNRALVFAR